MTVLSHLFRASARKERSDWRVLGLPLTLTSSFEFGELAKILWIFERQGHPGFTPLTPGPVARRKELMAFTGVPPVH